MYVKPHVCCGYLTMDGRIKTLNTGVEGVGLGDAEGLGVQDEHFETCFRLVDHLGTVNKQEV